VGILDCVVASFGVVVAMAEDFAVLRLSVWPVLLGVVGLLFSDTAVTVVSVA